jgi:hypothetical protein
MVARPANPTRSANAGEFSPDAAGRIDVRQYWSAGLAFKNIEPVPQGGFRQMGGTRRIAGNWRRPLSARAITDDAASEGPHTGTQTVWSGTVAGTVAVVHVGGFEIDAGTATFVVQALVDGDWVQVGHVFACGVAEVAVSRTAAFAPGGQRAATGLRIRATFSEEAECTIASVAAYHEDGAASRPRYVTLSADDGNCYSGFVTAGHVDFFTDAGFAGAARVPAVTAAMLPALEFYGEGRTIGVFHGQLRSQRLFLAPGAGADWQVDDWPFGVLPKADLGADYVKTSDLWEIFVRWVTSSTEELWLSIGVNGEYTPALQLSGAIHANANWAAFAGNLQTAINALPTISGAFVSQNTLSNESHRIAISFNSPNDGVEFQVDVKVASSAAISALPVHSFTGSTELEPVFSADRGWPGFAALYQDRLIHARIPAVSAAVAMSETAEYFEFNIEGQGDNAARLDRLRSQTSETVLAVKESKYLLVYTDLGTYFVDNRTIERNTALNFVRASEIGIQPNCRPFDLEGVDYYVAINPGGLDDAASGGKQLLSIVYDDVSTTYNADPVSLLATHLVDRITRAAVQRPLTDLDAAKGWLMRTDGRLIAAQFVRAQEIVGFCEWIAASGGLVREIGVDGRNRLWLAVERAAQLTYEIYDMALSLQDSVTVTPDLAGAVTGLPYENGAVVYACADGYYIGPFTVAAGAINLDDSYTSAVVGRWQAPRFESMPQVYVNAQDDVVWRPGRIHTAHLNLIDTTSVAVGANGQPAEDVVLTRVGDPADQPPAARTGQVTVTGLMGSADGTTLVITQTRPGRLRVRDFAIGARL